MKFLQIPFESRRLTMHLLLLFRNIHKPGQFRFPAKIYGSDRAVTLFRDNNLRRVRVIRILIIIIVTVQEHNNVGILLDRSGLSKVRKHRPVIRSRLAGTGKLGQGDHRDAQLPRDGL